MAEDLAPDRPLVAVRQPSRSERARRAAYRYRFGIIYFCLAAVVGAAVGAFVVVISKPDEHTSKADATKAFAPSSTGEVGAMELAARIARSYRKEGGGELVNVVASRNTLQDGSLGLLRVRFQVIQPVDAAKYPAYLESVLPRPADIAVVHDIEKEPDWIEAKKADSLLQ